jgi:hypothetical protein
MPTPEPAAEPPTATSPGWEPGVPTLRNFGPSLIFGGAIPLAAYYVARHYVHTDAEALIIAGAFPVAWILVQFARTRRVDPIGAIVLFGFVIGVGTSTLLGGNAYVLKARDSVFTAIFGLVCLVSLISAKRPAIFYIGRVLSAGDDPEKMAAYDQLHEMPTGQKTFRILTAVWGVGLLLEAATRLMLAAVVSTGVFVAINPVVQAVFLGSLFFFTVRYSNRARARGEALMADGQSYPSVPLA